MSAELNQGCSELNIKSGGGVGKPSYVQKSGHNPQCGGVLSDEQSWYRAARGTTRQIFTEKLLIEKHLLKQRHDLNHNNYSFFVDY